MITQEEVVRFLETPQMDQFLKKEAAVIRKQIKECKEQYSSVKEEMLFTLQTNNRLDIAGGKTQKVENVIEEADRLLQEQLDDLTSRHIFLLKEIEKNHRINLIIHTLSTQEQEIMMRIYRNHEKWDVLEMELDISRAQIARLRIRALNNIVDIYNSDISNRSLSKLQHWNPKQQETAPETPTRQLSILDLMGEET